MEFCYHKKVRISVSTFEVLVCGILFFTLLSPFYLFSQENARKNLETKRKEILKEIQKTKKNLSQTKRAKAATLDDYFEIQHKIESKEEAIASFKIEIEKAQVAIEFIENNVNLLKNRLNKMKNDYGAIMRRSLRQKLNHTTLLFLFSADNFNQAFRRFQYLKQYDQYLKKQVYLIQQTQAKLNEKVKNLEIQKTKKNTLLADNELKINELSQDLAQKEEIIAALKQDEKRLKTELNTQQANHEKLNAAIETMIRAEMEERRRAARRREELLRHKKAQEEIALARANEKTTVPKKTKPVPTKTPPNVPSETFEDSPENMALSENFRNNKGRLPPPIKNGTIVRYFGSQPHPTLRQIQISSNGIDIATEPDAEVRAVFKGVVSGIQFIPGYNNTVILQHGNYYTVYSNLDEVLVKRGQTVETKQNIGRVSINALTNRPEIHFEVWQNKQRLNPKQWISN